MRGGILINFDDYPILKNNISTLKETSKDTHNQSFIKYMTNSERAAVNFDDVKDEYIKNMSLSEIPKSNDALFINKKNKLVFVEFKNGFIDNAEKFAVRKKIYDSIIMLTDIIDTGITNLRDNIEYILVYNDSVNSNEKDVLQKKQFMMQNSVSFDYFAKSVSEWANREYICFGIRIFENYCFSRVHTYTEKEFERYLANN